MKSPRSAPYVLLWLSATLIVASFTIAPDVPIASAATQQTPAPNEDTSSMRSSENDEGVANLPFARGAVFRCLDDYLAHLERQGAIDLPWWREISPGVYEHMVRMTGAQRETATRQELMRRFEFSC